MDLSRSHYSAGRGTLFIFDQANRRIIPTNVQYENPSPYEINAGLNARVGGLIPNIDFQSTFVRAFFAAYDDMQKVNGSQLQFDGNRLAGFTGQGFIDGDMTFFVERQDKADDAQFRAEFRATLAVNKYDGTLQSLIAYIKGELVDLVAKQ